MGPAALHILIVDDSPEDRFVLRRLLTQAAPSAYRVTEASRGDQALAICETATPDCILLDYQLPDMDGLGVLAALRGRSDVPVVLLTGAGNESLAVEALKRGAQDYLAKGGLTPERLSLTAQRAVEVVRLTRERDQTTALLASVLASLPVGGAILDGDLRIRQANAALTSILGQPGVALPGQALPQLWPALAEQLAAPCARLMRGEHFSELELCLPQADGPDPRWLSFSGTPLVSTDGAERLILLTVQDITARRLAERELRASESRYRTLFETMAQGVIYHDNNGQIIAANPAEDITERRAAVQALEYERQQLTAIVNTMHEGVIAARPDGSLVLINPAALMLANIDPTHPPATLAEVAQRGAPEFITPDGQVLPPEAEPLPRVLRGEHFVGLELGLRFPQDGTQRWHRFNGTPVYDQDGALILGVVTGRDITERKRDEAQLRQQAAMLDHAHIFVLDAASRITSWNQGAERLYGWTAQEAIGRISQELLQTRFPTSREQVQAELLATGRWEGAVVHHRRDGSEVVVASLKLMFRDASGAPAHILEVNNDVTALKRAEEALREREAQLELAHAQAQTHAARLDSLLTNAPVGISLLDAELRFQAINTHLAELNGLPPEAHLGRTIREVLPDIAPLVEPIYAQVLSTGEPLVDVEIVGETPAEPGVSHTWTGTFFPVHTPDQTLLGVGATIVDITTQRKLERAIQIEHRQIAAILENLDEGVMAFQPDGTMVALNSAVRRHLGWPADAAPPTIAVFREISGHALYDHDGRRLRPEDYPTERALRGQSFQDVRLRLVGEHDGQESWFAFSGALAHDAEGALELLVVTARDITVEQQAGLALRENRQNLQVLIDNTDGALWSVDREFRVVVGNAAFRQLARALVGQELEAGELVMKEVLPPALLSMMSEYGARALAGEHLSGVVRVAVGGEERSLEYRVSPMRTAAGTIIGATTFARDITEQQRAEQALRDTERKLGTLFALLPIGISIFDAAGALAYTNPAMQRIMRLDRASLAAHAYNQRAVVRPDGTPLPASEFAGARALREQRPETDIEAGFITEAGERVWVSSSAVPVDFPDWRIVVVMTDITARIQAELALRANAETLARTNAELTQALRLKDEFLAMMSHELRTPLNAVLGVTEAMEEEFYGPVVDRQRQALGTATQSARHLLAILSDILDLTFIEAGKATLEVHAVDVDRLCRTALQLVQASAQAKGLHLFRTVVGEVEGLRADERRLTQILTNLLTNAVKFTPAGGRVGLEVAGDETQEHITFTVWDTGIGIAPEDMGRLFQPFTQVDGRLSRAYAGIGLGLTLVRRLAELHGGSVSLESTLGQGSRFTVSLPWPQGENVAPAAPRRPTPAPSAWVTPPRLVIADDHEGTLQFYADVLGEQGCQVVLARTGVEAVAQVRATRPDVAIIDVQMPELDGLGAIRQIRADSEVGATPIIALTALAMPGDRERCLAAGASVYLAKPVGIRALMAVIAKVLTDSNAGRTGASTAPALD